MKWAGAGAGFGFGFGVGGSGASSAIRSALGHLNARGLSCGGKVPVEPVYSYGKVRF